MDLLVERVDVWAAPIEDKPGGVARVLAGLRDAGADLGFVIARRSHEKSGEGVVFVTPIRGDRETEAAAELGFNVTNSLHSLRVEGTVEHPERGSDWEYSVVLTIRNERGEELSRQVVGVGALRAGEARTFTLAVDVLTPGGRPK